MSTGYFLRCLFLSALLAATMPPMTPSGASAGKFNTVYSFCSLPKCKDGSAPVGLSADQAGNIFGATQSGDRSVGTIFELIHGKSYGLLYRFRCEHQGCPNGKYPTGSLIVDTQGNLYGTTVEGGAGGSKEFGGGVAFELVRDGDEWTYKKLYDFCLQGGYDCLDGLFPGGGLTYAGAATGAAYDGTSPLFGVTQVGGANSQGTVFQLISNGDGSWSQSVLYSFCAQGGELCTDGKLPWKELLPDANGNLFGVAEYGGTNLNANGQGGAGVVFELNPTDGGWTYSVLYDFCALANCADGLRPGSLLRDAGGTLYGLTGQGGAPCQEQSLMGESCGVLFKLAQKSSRWQESVLYAFCQQADCLDGASPSSVVLESNDALLGTTWAGGGNDEDGNHIGSGVLFELSGRRYKVVHSFCSLPQCADGQSPAGPVVQDNGAVVGATSLGGAENAGVVFEYETGMH